MKFITLIVFILLSTTAFSQPSQIVVSLDYDWEQDCETSPICFGFLDFARSVEYDTGTGEIFIETFLPSSCIQDGILRDRFQTNTKIFLNGERVGTLKSFEYNAGSTLITIQSFELNYDCYEEYIENYQNKLNDLMESGTIVH